MTAGRTTAKKLISMLLCMLMMFPAFFSVFGYISFAESPDISGFEITLPSEVYYTAGGTKPLPEIRNGDTLLQVGRDFTVSYTDNKATGTGYVTITGEGNYSGSVKKSFAIKQRDISDTEITVSDIFFNADGSLPKVGVSAEGKYFREGTDYTIDFSENEDGTITVTVTGIGGLCGTAEKTYGVKKVPLSCVDIRYDNVVTYSGKEVYPNLEIYYQDILLTENKDYTVTYSDNTQIGTAGAVVTGLGIYIGTVSFEYEIQPIQMADTEAEIIFSEDFTSYEVKILYNGVTLIKDTDYTMTVTKNGDYDDITLTGMGICGGTAVKSLRVRNLNHLDMAVISKIPDQTYTGEYIRPDFSVSYEGEELVYGVDYYITYQNNINVGSTCIMLYGMGDNAGTTRKAPFNIVPLDLGSCKTICDNMAYTGAELFPVPVITYNNYTLTEGKDFVIDGYADNKNAGEGTVTVTGIGNFCGTIQIKFTIVKKEDMQDKVQNCLDEMMAGEHDRQIYDYMHSYKVGNYYNTLMTSPCTCHSYCNTGYESGCTCLIGRSTVLNNNGIQCAGFTMEVFEYLFGNTNGAGENICTIYNRSSSEWTEKAIKEWMTNTFRPGDYLAYDNVVYEYPHYIIVYAVESDGIWVYEANYGGRCKINFRKMTYTEIYNQLDGLYHRTPVNYELGV